MLELVLVNQLHPPQEVSMIQVHVLEYDVDMITHSYSSSYKKPKLFSSDQKLNLIKTVSTNFKAIKSSISYC